MILHIFSKIMKANAAISTVTAGESLHGSLPTHSVKETQTRDMVIDFGDFKDTLKELTNALDHSLIIESGSLKPATMKALEEEDFRIIEFPFRRTAEQLSHYFYTQFKERSFPVYSISVYETPNNCATYQEA